MLIENTDMYFPADIKLMILLREKHSLTGSRNFHIIKH